MDHYVELEHLTCYFINIFDKTFSKDGNKTHDTFLTCT